MAYTISKDGEEWYEVSDDIFKSLVADPNAECWVDLTKPGEKIPLVMALSAMRSLRECEGPLPGMPWKMPTHLYGIPVVFTEELK